MSRKARWFRPDALPRLADYTLLIALILPTLIGFWKLTDFLQIQQCPPDAFKTGSMRSGLFGGPYLGMMGVAATLGYAARHTIYHLVPSLRKRLKPRLSCTKKGGHWDIGTLWIALLLGSAGWLWYEAFSQYCLSDQAILHRREPLQAFQRHEWTDVAAVATGCQRRHKRGPDITYALIMKDGTAIDIAESVQRLQPIFPRLQQNLRNRPFQFDASGVDPNCPSYITNFLRIRP